MTFWGKSKKVDLIELATELSLPVPAEAKVVDLKHIITESESNDEKFSKELLDRITEDRIASKAAAEALAVHEFELEKLRIQNHVQDINTSDLGSNHEESRNVHIDFRKLMHEYNIKDGDINFYLVLFERQVRRVGLNEEHWVSQLLGLLPYEITQLIARENEENANNYKYVKSLLLKRYKCR